LTFMNIQNAPAGTIRAALRHPPFRALYALGDVTSAGTPKAGVFAEGQALVVASQIISRLHNGHRADQAARLLAGSGR
jgi:hypothetical protein